MKKENINADDMEDKLNKESGLFGISGVSVDMRDIEFEAQSGGIHAQLAMDVFHYQIAGYIAKCAVAMNGVDAICFTGGIGENQVSIRKGICEKLQFMGVEIDDEANKSRGEEKLISKHSSKVEVYVIPTNEELMIAKETKRLIEN